MERLRLAGRRLASLEAQTVPVDVVVVDNASTDETLQMLSTRFPDVTVVRNTENLGFGRAVNRGAAAAGDADVMILVNNDAVCAPDFVAQLLEPFADPAVGMAAGVLLQAADHGLIDSAGIELDTTLGSWDYLWNHPVSALVGARDPVGPCGGAAAYRLEAFRELGGFDETLFAYWEDVDLALRFRAAGWRCVLAPVRARCTSTGRRSAPRRPRRAGSRRSAAATCSRSTASAAAACFGGERSPRSTGRRSPSTSSCGARPGRRASDCAPVPAACGRRASGLPWSSPRSASGPPWHARQPSFGSASRAGSRPTSRDGAG